MTTKIEVNGFEIEIKENENGIIEINVTREGEQVDEMSLDPAEFTDEETEETETETETEMGSSDVQSFDEFGGAEMEGTEVEEEEEQEIQVESATFKTFQDFIK